jgi:hypothetical protein
MDEDRLAAEQRARVLIDRQLTDAGWVVQDRKDLNLFAGQGIAVREVIMAKGYGRADYLLYVDQLAVGVIEAKPAGTPLSGVEWQSAMYAEGLPADVRLKAVATDGRLPFVFEASGSEIHFTNGFDPHPRRDGSSRSPSRPPWLGPCAMSPPIRSARPGAAKWPRCQTWTSSCCGPRRSPRSAASSGPWPSSASTGRWCRWPPERARPTRR